MTRASRLAVGLVGLVALGLAAPAQAVTINFSEFAVGTVIDTEYAPFGVTFAVEAAGNLPVIANDNAMPGSPVLSPAPPYSGAFNMLFSVLVTSVSFQSGYWDAVGTAAITVYDPSNALVGTFTNTVIGAENMTFTHAGGIGRILFNSTGDGAGGDIDNLEFAPVPEPGTMVLLGAGLLGLAGRVRRRSRS